MGRGTRKDDSNSLKSGAQMDSREVIFKSANKSESIIKQAETEEAEKFARLREQKKAEQSPPTEIDENGNRFWKNSAGELHRDGDLPAREWVSGAREWYQKGKLHREGDLPARERADGTREWYQNGKPYRDGDKPTLEDSDRVKIYFNQNFEYHRDGGPAIEWAGGRKEWYQNGKLHRDGDLPAWERADGSGMVQKWLASPRQ